MKKTQNKETTNEIINQLNGFAISGRVVWVSDDTTQFIVSTAYKSKNKDGKVVQSYTSNTVTDWDKHGVEVGDVVTIEGHFTTRKYNGKYYNNMVADKITV